MRYRRQVRRSCYFLFQDFYGPIPLDQHDAAGVAPDGVFRACCIDDVAAAAVIAGFVGLHAFQNQDGFETFMAMLRGTEAPASVLQEGDTRLVALEGTDPVDCDILREMDRMSGLSRRPDSTIHALSQA